MNDKPVALGLQASFGFGDRIGLATPGHVAAMKRCGAGIAPIFPQQSIREMTRTARSPQQVMNDAMSGRRQLDGTIALGLTQITSRPPQMWMSPPPSALPSSP